MKGKVGRMREASTPKRKGSLGGQGGGCSEGEGKKD